MILNTTQVSTKTQKRYILFLAKLFFLRSNKRPARVLFHISIIIYAILYVPLVYLLIFELLVNFTPIFLLFASLFIKTKTVEKYEFNFAQDYFSVKRNDGEKINISYDSIKVIYETKNLFFVQTKEKIKLNDEPYFIDKMSFNDDDYLKIKDIEGFKDKISNVYYRQKRR